MQLAGSLSRKKRSIGSWGLFFLRPRERRAAASAVSLLEHLVIKHPINDLLERVPGLVALSERIVLGERAAIDARAHGSPRRRAARPASRLYRRIRCSGEACSGDRGAVLRSPNARSIAATLANTGSSNV